MDDCLDFEVDYSENSELLRDCDSEQPPDYGYKEKDTRDRPSSASYDHKQSPVSVHDRLHRPGSSGHQMDENVWGTFDSSSNENSERKCSGATEDGQQVFPTIDWPSIEECVGQSVGEEQVAAGYINFPSQEFMNLNGMAFIDQTSEIQREVALLAWKLAPAMMDIYSGVKELSSSPSNTSCRLYQAATCIIEGQKQSSVTSEFTNDEKETFAVISKNMADLSLNGNALLCDNRAVLFQNVNCQVFQLFTSRFALKNLKPILSMLKQDFMLASKTLSHSSCDCLPNPLIKYAQVEKNIPSSVLCEWYSKRNQYCSRVGDVTHRLALQSRGHRPTKIVLIIDTAIIPMSCLSGVLLSSVDVILRGELLSAPAILQLISTHYTCGNDCLYIVMTGYGRVLAKSAPSMEVASSNLLDSTGWRDDDDDVVDNFLSSSDTLEELLYDRIVQEYLLLWEGVLSLYKDADMLFVPLMASKMEGRRLWGRDCYSMQQCTTLHGGSDCQNTLRCVVRRYNEWTLLQQTSTGRAVCSAPENIINDKSTVKDILEHVTEILVKCKEDINIYENYIRPAILRPRTMKKFKMVYIVIDCKFSGAIEAYKQLYKVKVCPVTSMESTEVLEVITPDLVSDSLVILIPSFINSANFVTTLDSGVLSLDETSTTNDFKSDTNQLLVSLREVVTSLRSSGVVKAVSAVVLPLLPLHVVSGSDEPPPPPTAARQGAQLLHSKQPLATTIPEDYLNMDRELFEVVQETFQQEKLVCNSLEDFNVNLVKGEFAAMSAPHLCTVGQEWPEPLLDVYGPWGSLLADVIFSGLRGFFLNSLPPSTALSTTMVYPSLVEKISLEEAKTSRISHIALVGSFPPEVVKRYEESDTVSIITYVCFSNSGMRSFLRKVARLPPDTLFIFKLDPVILFSKAEVYPDCIKNGCKVPIMQHNIKHINSYEGDYLSSLCLSRVQEVINKLSLLKKVLPNQGELIVWPSSPQRLLLVENPAKSFFNHFLLHKYNVTIVQGYEESWSSLHETGLKIFKENPFSFDVHIEELLRGMGVHDVETDMQVCRELISFSEPNANISRVAELVFSFIEKFTKLSHPVRKITEEDRELLKKAIVQKKTVQDNLDKIVASYQLSLAPASEVTGLAAPLSESQQSSSIELTLHVGHCVPPAPFIQTLADMFGAVCDPKRHGNCHSGYFFPITLADEMRAALFIAILDNFRCCFTTFSVTSNEGTQLPTPSVTELKRLKDIVWEKLLLFSTACNYALIKNLDPSKLGAQSRLHVDAERESYFIEGMDSTLHYLLKELIEVQSHHQKEIIEGKVLAVIVTHTAEEAHVLHYVLNNMLADDKLFPTHKRPLRLLSKESSNRSGHIILGTSRYVMAEIKSITPEDVQCLQLLLIEKIKSIISSDQRKHMMDLVAVAKHMHSSNKAVRMVVVCPAVNKEELSGANTVLGRQLHLIRREADGSAYISHYYSDDLPKVAIPDTSPPSVRSPFNCTQTSPSFRQQQSFQPHRPVGPVQRPPTPVGSFTRAPQYPANMYPRVPQPNARMRQPAPSFPAQMSAAISSQVRPRPPTYPSQQFAYNQASMPRGVPPMQQARPVRPTAGPSANLVRVTMSGSSSSVPNVRPYTSGGPRPVTAGALSASQVRPPSQYPGATTSIGQYPVRAGPAPAAPRAMGRGAPPAAGPRPVIAPNGRGVGQPYPGYPPIRPSPVGGVPPVRGSTNAPQWRQFRPASQNIQQYNQIGARPPIQSGYPRNPNVRNLPPPHYSTPAGPSGNRSHQQSNVTPNVNITIKPTVSEADEQEPSMSQRRLRSRSRSTSPGARKRFRRVQHYSPDMSPQGSPQGESTSKDEYPNESSSGHSYSRAEQSIRSELEREYNKYESQPELHPCYEDHWNTFLEIYEEQYGQGRDQMHRQKEWQSIWMHVLKEEFEKEFQKRRANTDVEKSRMLKERMMQRIASRSQPSVAGGGYGASGTSLESMGINPRSVAEQTLGMSSVQTARYIKQLVASKLSSTGGNCTSAAHQLLQQVTALHMEFAAAEE